MATLRFHDPLKELRESMTTPRFLDPLNALRESMTAVRLQDPLASGRGRTVAAGAMGPPPDSQRQHGTVKLITEGYPPVLVGS